MSVCVWKARLGGTFAGSLLFPVAGRVVGLVRTRPTSSLKAWLPNGKPAWSVAFERGDAGFFFAFGGDAYVDGREALRVRGIDGEIVARRGFAEPVHVCPAAAQWPVYLTGRRTAPTSMLGLDPKTLAPQWEIRDVAYTTAHGNLACTRDPRSARIEVVALPELTRRSVIVPLRADEEGVPWHTHVDDLWCQFFDRQRVAVDLTTGSIRWQHHEAESGFHGYISETKGDYIYCGNRGLSCYAGRTGALIWRNALGDEMLSSRFWLLDGVIVAATQRGGLYWLNADDGRIVHQQRLVEEPMAIAPLDRTRVAVASYDVLSCYDFT